jgi:biopolymer transport protein ExbB/TolQ
MGTLEIVKWLADACYGFLALNFLWGMTCVIIIWRRLNQLSFRSIAAETEFVENIEGLLKERDYKTAAERCDFDFRALPRLCLLMIANREQSYGQLRQLIASNVQRHFLGDLEHRLGSLVTVIKSGPLLGLFGTVLGMMAAFGRIGTGEKVQPSQIADEISVALICTAMGLGTAIPLGYILSHLSIRTRTLQDSLESNLARILQHFRRTEAKP